MILITCTEDATALNDDPIFRREVLAYLHACRADCDSQDDQTVDFVVMGKEDVSMLAEHCDPEETARIEIHANGGSRVITRLVFVASVYFAPFDIAHSKGVPPWPG